MTDIVQQARTWLPGGSGQGDLVSLVQHLADEIERLRLESGVTTGMALEAADEIERLRDGNTLLRRDRDDHKAEINRLKSERDRWYDAAQRRLEELEQLRAKNPAPSTE